MFRLVFVRHGDDINDRLTRLGKKQAKILAKQLDVEGIDAIFCSPKNRAFKTAKILARHLKIADVVIDERLDEREKISSTTNNEDLKEFKLNYLNTDYSHKNPEGCKQYFKRILDFLNEIRTKNQGKTVLIVGHSSFTYVLLSYVYGSQNTEAIWSRVSNCAKLCFELDVTQEDKQKFYLWYVLN